MAQHGVVARRQLLGSDWGAGAIEDGLPAASCSRVHCGVYAVGHRALTSREGRWMAAVIAAGPGAVLSHRSAGSLWGSCRQMSILLEVTRATRCQARPGISKSHCGLLERRRGRADRGRDPGHLAAAHDARPGRRPRRCASWSGWSNEMEVLGLHGPLSIPRPAGAIPAQPWARRTCGRCWRTRQPSVESPATNSRRRFAVLLDTAGLPRPRLNADLAVRGRILRSRLPVGGAARLIVELDGRAAHGTRRAFERDRERDRLLLVDGWRVMRVTWRQLRDEPRRDCGLLADLSTLMR